MRYAGFRHSEIYQGASDAGFYDFRRLDTDALSWCPLESSTPTASSSPDTELPIALVNRTAFDKSLSRLPTLQ